MSKTVVKHNKKEEQKKLMVRIVCMVLVVALVVTSILAMFPTLFEDHTDSDTIEELLAAGILYVGEDGNYYYNEEYLTTVEGDDHECHDHD